MLFRSVTCMHTVGNFSKEDVLLDSASNTHIFNNKQLLSNIKKLEEPIKIGGVDSNGTHLSAEESGTYGPFTHVLYHPEATANILSLAKAQDQSEIIFDSEGDGVFKIKTQSHGTYEFIRKGLETQNIHLCQKSELSSK